MVDRIGLILMAIPGLTAAAVLIYLFDKVVSRF